MVVIVPAVAVKVVEVLLAGTVTEVVTGSAALLLDRPTAVPPVGAVWVSVTVQVVADPELTLVGLQAREEMSVGAIKDRVALFEEPARDAVIEAD